MKKEIICTVCPRGCHIQVEGEGDQILNVEGYGCKRGLEYGSSEFAHPVRILTTTVKLEGVQNDLLPVRSNKPLPKEKIMEYMQIIRATAVKAPVVCYDVVIADICGCGVDIVATKTVEG